VSKAPTEPKPAPVAAVAVVKAPTEPTPEAAVAVAVVKAPTEPNAVGWNPADRDRGGRSWPLIGGNEEPSPGWSQPSDR
jgi:hypothetical protein